MQVMPLLELIQRNCIPCSPGWVWWISVTEMEEERGEGWRGVTISDNTENLPALRPSIPYLGHSASSWHPQDDIWSESVKSTPKLHHPNLGRVLCHFKSSVFKFPKPGNFSVLRCTRNKCNNISWNYMENNFENFRETFFVLSPHPFGDRLSWLFRIWYANYWRDHVNLTKACFQSTHSYIYTLHRGRGKGGTMHGESRTWQRTKEQKKKNKKGRKMEWNEKESVSTLLSR